jgi:hypothetical protein
MPVGSSSDPGREAPPHAIVRARAAGVAGVHPRRYLHVGSGGTLDHADDVLDVPSAAPALVRSGAVRVTDPTGPHRQEGPEQNGNKTARRTPFREAWEQLPFASSTAGQQGQRLLQVPLEHLSADEGHRDREAPALALPASVQDHPDVTAGAAIIRSAGTSPSTSTTT